MVKKMTKGLKIKLKGSSRDPRTRAGWSRAGWSRTGRSRAGTRAGAVPGPIKTEKYRTNPHRAVRGPNGAWIPGQ